MRRLLSRGPRCPVGRQPIPLFRRLETEVSAYTKGGNSVNRAVDLSAASPASAILHHEKCVRRSSGLLHLEGQAVCALTYGRIRFVSSYLYLVEGAVILAAAVMLAVVDSTADMLVCKFSSHYDHSFLIEKTRSCCRTYIICGMHSYIPAEIFYMLDSLVFLCYHYRKVISVRCRHGTKSQQ